MKRLALVFVGCLSGCFPFEEKYKEVVMHLPDGSTPADSGVSPEDAGQGDAGVPDAGTDAGMSGSSCDASLCLRFSYVTPGASSVPYLPLSYMSGLVVRSLDDFVVVSCTKKDISSSNFEYVSKLWRVLDGGVESQDLGLYNQVAGVAGSRDNYWIATTYGVHQFLNDQFERTETECQYTDGGSHHLSFWGAREVGGRIYFPGAPYSLCRLESNGPLTELLESSPARDSVYLYDTWRGAAGPRYVVGGEYHTSATSQVFNADDGTLVSLPPDSDPDGYGLVAIDGQEEDVWAVSRSGAIYRRQANGEFASEVDAGSFSMRGLAVAAIDDVWVVGGARTNGRVLHFDGASWKVVPIPDSSGTIWERVVVVDGGLVLVGHRSVAVDDWRGIIRVYERPSR